MNGQALSLYITTEHPCGYFDDRLSSNLIPDPQVPMTAGLYSLLVSKGFRRSGGFVYQPHCKSCHDCIPSRINVNHYKPNRNQRRCLKKNSDLVTRITHAHFSDEYFDLYLRYMNERHMDGSMSNPQPEDFKNFLLCDWSQSIFIETRLNNKLLSVAVADYLNAGLSAVYTFFEPEEQKRSLGTFAIMQEIWFAQTWKLPHVYLGYWIKQHPKMHYKGNFKGLETFESTFWKAHQ